MLSRILEWDIATSGNNAWLALRMRVSMSAIGSLLMLPARFRYAWDQAVQRRFTERETRRGEFTKVPAAASAHFAAVHQAHRARVLRKLRQPRVILLRFQFSAHRGVLLHRRGLSLVALNP